MTKRNPVSTIQPIWTDAQEVSDSDLITEQGSNDAKHASNVLNHIGTGILSDDLTPNVLFDSLATVGFLDGKPINVQVQPSDENYGNQLEIELAGSKVAGTRTVKVGVIGLDFEGALKYETFIFRRNEKQIGKRHFTKILVLLFNDFQGNPNLSLNLGGTLVIREAASFSLSRDALSIAQDVEPNLFFRDFFLDGFLSLQTLLQTALPFYEVDKLDIFTGEKNTLVIQQNDVVTQIGQKFAAKSNNIQKLTLLMSVKNTDLGNEDDLSWNGDLVVSIYALQSTLDCPSDIAPDLPIEFSPNSIPIAQVSVNYNTLLARGYELNSVPQPVDFIFTNTPAAAGTAITPGNYYAFSVTRKGSANKCDIQLAAGGDRLIDSRVTTFSGTLWVDLPEEDLWFQVWSDAAKVSDGQAYENGQGIAIDKTILDLESQATIDYSLSNVDFRGTSVYKAIVSAVQETFEELPDQRTGDPVASRKKYVPQISLLNELEISNLESVSDPLIIGAISDKNVKAINSLNSTISSKLYSATFVGSDLLIRIVDDPTDSVRFDSTVTSLAANLLNGDFVGAKITPNSNDPSKYYRIAGAKLSTMIVGDVNGDGIVDEADLTLLLGYKDYDLNKSNTATSSVVTDGYVTTYTNGYTASVKKFSSASGLNFQVVNPQNNFVMASGSDGILVPNPNDPRSAQFASAAVNFSIISNLSTYKLVINNPATPENTGGFTIVKDVSNVLTINKILLTEESISQMFRADIDGDFHVTSNDGYLLQHYLDREVLNIIPAAPFPGPSSDSYNKIGTSFNVIKLSLEKFVDRHDDYSVSLNARAGDVHTQQDLFTLDGTLQNRNFYNNPSTLTIEKQLTWSEELIVVETGPRLVPSAFTTNGDYVDYECSLVGVQDNSYPVGLDFNPGKNDFFVPNNLILGSGQLLNPDGSYHKIDFEVGTVLLEVPDSLYGTEQVVNIFSDFVYDYTGNGVTRAGYKAMRFSDCSPVSATALSDNQIRFSVSVQSFSPNINGITSELYEGIIVDGKIGVSIDYNTGLLSLNFTNLFEDSVLKTLNTKIQVQVFLKKSGFNNTPLLVDSDKLKNMLSLVSNYTGSGINNLVIPISGGGGGSFTPAGDLAGTSSSQTVIKLQGRPVANVNPSTNQVLQWNGSTWAPATIVTGGGAITNVQDGANYSNTFNVVGYSNNSTTSSNSFIVGSTFEFDKSSFKSAGSGSRVINLKVIAETTGPQMTIRLFNVTASAVVTGSTLTTTSITPVVLTTADIAANLATGSAIYQVQIKMDTGTTPDRISLDYAGLKIVWS